jgi:hypothetical protein
MAAFFSRRAVRVLDLVPDATAEHDMEHAVLG